MTRAGKDYGVEVIRAYQFKRVGQVIYPAGAERDRLVQSGFVKRRKAETEIEAEPLGETTAVNQKKSALNSPADRSMRSTQMQLKGRR